MSKQVVKVFLTNRIASLHRPYPYEDIIPFYSYSVPGFQFMQRRYPGWDGKKKKLKYDKLPSGLFLATKDEIEQKLPIRFDINYKRKLPRKAQGRPLVSDREYQNDCVEAMVKAGRCGGLILSATGTGKTRMVGQYASRVAGPLLFVVDQLDLLWQAKKEIQETLGESIGFVGDQKFKPRRVTIATVQTMHKHRRDLQFRAWTDKIEVVVIDEVHTQINRRNFDVVSEIAPYAVFGLTATLGLQKKAIRVEAYSLTGPICFQYPLRQGVDERFLSRGIVIRVRMKNEVKI